METLSVSGRVVTVPMVTSSCTCTSPSGLSAVVINDKLYYCYHMLSTLPAVDALPLKFLIRQLINFAQSYTWSCIILDTSNNRKVPCRKGRVQILYCQCIFRGACLSRSGPVGRSAGRPPPTATGNSTSAISQLLLTPF